MSDMADFDRYCTEHEIKPGEEPAAFAAWLNEQTGWDGPMEKVEAAGDLASWLLEQIAEDESNAHALHDRNDDRFQASDLCGVDCACGVPRRVLAECEAKRRIIAIHAGADGDAEHYCPTADGDSEYWNYMRGWAEEAENPQNCTTLRLLALPYADRPGYREEWRPQ